MKPVTIIGVYLLLASALLVAFPIWVYMNPFEKPLMNILVYIACSGGIGGTIYCIRGFYRNLGSNEFTLNWTWWYIFRPIISAMIGIFAYFLIIGGLMSISNSPDVNYAKSVMFYCAVAFIAGYSINKFFEKLDALSGTIFGNNGNGNNPNG